MKRGFIFAIVMMLVPALLLADAGVLIPRDKQQPTPAILSLEEMEVTVRIDNGDARVFVRQVFANHTGAIEEGNYVFALPSHATISDFATWDGPVRLPAVILERKRAEEIYNQLKQQSVDPGLLQMGERGAEEAKRSSVFSARITPIPAWGTKRLEIEYHESIPVENLKSYFAIPLAARRLCGSISGSLPHQFRIALCLCHSQLPGCSEDVSSAARTEHAASGAGTLRGTECRSGRRFRRDVRSRSGPSDTLQLLTYRNPVSALPSPTETAPVRSCQRTGIL